MTSSGGTSSATSPIDSVPSASTMPLLCRLNSATSLQLLHRVGGEHRQRHQQRGDLVGALDRAGADVHRHAGDERLLRQRVALHQVVAQRRRVTAASTTSLTFVPNASLIALMSAKSTFVKAASRDAGQPAVDVVDVRRRERQRHRRALRDGAADHAAHLPEPLRRAGDHLHATHRPARRVQRRPARRATTADGAALGSRRGRRLDLAALGPEVEQVRHHVGAGRAVQRRVVHLRDQRDLAGREPLDEPQLPQRPAAVEQLGADLADQRAERVQVARRRQRDAVQVRVEVDVGVVDPVRVVHVQRHLHEPPLERRQQVDAAPRAPCGTARS